MRVLALQDVKTGEYAAFTVDDVQYDEEVAGVGFHTPDGHYYFIPNLSMQECNNICRNLVLQGYCDVTRYGEIEET